MSRLWVDANVILRFLTKDPQDLAERSARLMAKAEKGKVSLYISLFPAFAVSIDSIPQ